ncbi:MAG: OB-fold domain-containing protein [Chloroflexi bacterium]|nr:OB-fold domain-containing protein [Chloroflexota bacterium]
MVGIAAYGAYIPRYRLGAETVGWNSRQERAVANFDEDSVTMAVAAGSDCLAGRDRALIDGIVFASTTPPYAEKQCAAIVAAALDLRTDIFAVDVANVLRAGTNALQAALDAVASGRGGQVLVVVADSRQGPPRGETERASGDGAAAFVVADREVIAEHVGSHAVTDNMLDSWRAPGDPFVRTWEDRFATEEGIERIVPDAVTGYCQRTDATPADVAKIALYAPDARRHARLARQLGFADNQVQEPLFGAMGNTGAAFAPMLLASALETAKPDDLLLTVSYGDGSDVIGFRATGAVAQSTPQSMGVSGWLEAKRTLSDYETYARWREVWTLDDASRRPAAASPSVSALWREGDKNVRLYGARCLRCGYVQYPAQRVCVECRTVDESEPVRLSETPAEVFTYSMDYIAGAVDTPLVVAVVDFRGGGRVLCMITDRELDEIRVGMPVEMSFRKLRVVNGIHNYYWKAMPRRTPEPAAVAA